MAKTVSLAAAISLAILGLFLASRGSTPEASILGRVGTVVERGCPARPRAGSS